MGDIYHHQMAALSQFFAFALISHWKLILQFALFITQIKFQKKRKKKTTSPALEIKYIFSFSLLTFSIPYMHYNLLNKDLKLSRGANPAQNPLFFNLELGVVISRPSTRKAMNFD